MQARECTVPPLRILTWNVYHGRTVPPCGRSRLGDFARALAGWEWDVALLQEVPPWWPAPLAAAAGGVARLRLTSRNRLLPVQRAIAERNPDVLKASGGGCNAILVRGHDVLEHREVRLRRLPEGRWAHGVRLRDAGWVVNVHSQDRPELAARTDTERAATAAREWAGGAPLVFGGDVNLRRPALDGLLHVAGNHVDHIFTDGRPAAGRRGVLDRGTLSDHAPVAVTLA
jgi:endonuclease/exonuclease/phosphatase family metal-dependent hydrolase